MQNEINVQIQLHNKYTKPSEAKITETRDAEKIKKGENKKLSLNGKYNFLVTKSAAKMFEQLKDLIIKESKDVDNGSIYCQVDNEISVGIGKFSFKLKKGIFITMPNTSGNVFTSPGQAVVGTNKREKSELVSKLNSITTDVVDSSSNTSEDNCSEKIPVIKQINPDKENTRKRSLSL